MTDVIKSFVILPFVALFVFGSLRTCDIDYANDQQKNQTVANPRASLYQPQRPNHHRLDKPTNPKQQKQVNINAT